MPKHTECELHANGGSKSPTLADIQVNYEIERVRPWRYPSLLVRAHIRCIQRAQVPICRRRGRPDSTPRELERRRRIQRSLTPRRVSSWCLNAKFVGNLGRDSIFSEKACRERYHKQQALEQMNGFELANRPIREGLGNDKFTPESTASLLRNFNTHAQNFQGSAFSGAGGRGAYAGGSGKSSIALMAVIIVA